MGSLMFPIDAIAGVDQRGAPYASFLLDPVGGGLGALSWRDGVNTGGWPWDLQSTMPNVEDNEIFYPLVYLWRKEIPNSGGAGKFRGGNSAELAYILNDTDGMTHYTTGGHCIIPGPGLFGGGPTSRTRYMLVEGAKVQAEARHSGRMPGGLDELSGTKRNVPPKAGDVRQNVEDVFVMAWASAGGYGDPLERDPALIRADLADMNITRDWAEDKHGAVFDAGGEIDLEATAARREAIRKGRIGAGGGLDKPEFVQEAGKDRPVSEGLVITVSGERRVYVCRKCRAVIEDADKNYKSGCITRETELDEVGLVPIDPAIFIDDHIVYREYFCPQCGLLLQGDFRRKTDPDKWDIQLKM